MFYPLFVNLSKKKILVIGGGNVGSRRALYLLNSGAIVTVISKKFSSALLKIKSKRLVLIKKGIRRSGSPIQNIDGYFLVVIATDNKRINKAMHDSIIKSRKNDPILVCRADNHSAGDVIFPSVSKVGNSIVAFTTFGRNPKLSKKVKELLYENAKS